MRLSGLSGSREKNIRYSERKKENKMKKIIEMVKKEIEDRRLLKEWMK